MSKRKERERIIAKWNTFREEALKELDEQDISAEIYVAKRFQLEDDIKRAINMDLNDIKVRRERDSRIITAVVAFASPFVLSYLIQAGMSLSYQEQGRNNPPIEILPKQEETMPEEDSNNILYPQEM